MKLFSILTAFTCAVIVPTYTFAQTQIEDVYALKIATKGKVPIAAVAVGANSKDSVSTCYMFWALKATNGKTILVDAGFTDTTALNLFSYTRPDVTLARINIQPKDVSDIIITHPHRDHLNGIELFPDAMIWMQREDYNYFVGAAWQKGGSTIGFKKKDVTQLVQRNLEKKLTLVNGDNIEIIPGIRVFTGSKHTYESQFVQITTKTDVVVIASDASWFYYNVLNDLPIPMTLDAKGYTANLKKMKGMVNDAYKVIPGHDPMVFSKFPKVAEDVVRIGR